MIWFAKWKTQGCREWHTASEVDETQNTAESGGFELSV